MVAPDEPHLSSRAARRTDPDDSLPRAGSGRVCAALGALVVAVAATALVKVGDYDVFWHVKTGEWTWAHGAPPSVDLFSYTSSGKLAYSEPLADLFFYGLYAAGEASALVLGTAALTAILSALAVALSRGEGPGSREARWASESSLGVSARVCAVCLWAAASQFRFGPQTDIFTFLALAALLVILSRARGATWALLAIPPLFALWANLHRGGVVGLFVVMVFAGFEGLRGNRRLALAECGAAIAGSVALCANPAGAAYLSAAFDLTTRASFRQVLPEWRPIYPAFLYREDPAFPALALLWAWSVAVRRPRHAMDVVGAALLLLATTTVRFVPLAAIAMIPGAAFALESCAHRVERRTRGTLRPSIVALGFAAGGFVVLGGAYARTVPASWAGVGIRSWVFPIDASRFLARAPPPGRMYNSFDYGGYLLFALGPAEKVFIDGRNDTVYAPSFFADYVRADHDAAFREALFDRFGVTYAVLECGGLECRNDLSLQVDPAWVPVYFDDAAVVLVRRSPATAEYLARHAYATLRPAQSVERLLQFGGDPNAAVLEADILRNAAEAPGSVRAQYMAAVVHRARGRLDDYRRARASLAELITSRDISLDLP